jgi:hypothetical protein
VAYYISEQRGWQKMYHRQSGMMFDREPTIRCRHKETLSHPADLIQEERLTLSTAGMFQNRIAENDIELAISEWKIISSFHALVFQARIFLH